LTNPEGEKDGRPKLDCGQVARQKSPESAEATTGKPVWTGGIEGGGVAKKSARPSQGDRGQGPETAVHVELVRTKVRKRLDARSPPNTSDRRKLRGPSRNTVVHECHAGGKGHRAKNNGSKRRRNKRRKIGSHFLSISRDAAM